MFCLYQNIDGVISSLHYFEYFCCAQRIEIADAGRDFFSKLNKHFPSVQHLVSGFKFKLFLMLSICLPTLHNRDFL